MKALMGGFNVLMHWWAGFNAFMAWGDLNLADGLLLRHGEIS